MIAADALVGVGAAASASTARRPPRPTTTDRRPTTPTTTSNVDSGAGLPTDHGDRRRRLLRIASDHRFGGLSTAAGLAIGLIAVGFGLFAVTRARRGQLSGT